MQRLPRGHRDSSTCPALYAGRRLVLKSPVHTARVELLLKLFPDAQFIYIHRDPETVYR